MKKKILAILLVVTIVTALAVGLTACGKKDQPVEKPSNAETLATAMAMATQGGKAVAAAQEEAQKEGINIDFGGNVAVSGVIKPALSIFEKYLSEYIDKAELFIKDNNVQVKEEPSDNEKYNTMYTITFNYTEDGEALSKVIKFYINATKVDSDEKADVNGSEAYDFTAELNAGSEVIVKVSGTARYDKNVDGLKFTVGVGVDGVGVYVSAYANNKGNIVADVQVGAESTGVKVKVELGNLAENTYGADISVSVKVANSVEVLVDVEVKASANEQNADFVVNGDVSATVDEHAVIVAINGTASYNAEDVLELALSGNVNIK